ncbi:PIN domain-containing protein [Deinococcus frigens]|uniref:PIN domain-containing protein n=1 Tax=Deinococcus frigens TaxID=249403 RepID=UPI00068D25D5|nr:PIN domain-containing protein [Deinococcus frigens]
MKVLIDANVLLRFLLDDHADLSPRAATMFERAARGELTLLVPSAILAECAYTLKSFYKLGREELVDGLLTLLDLPGVRGLEDEILRQTLTLFRKHNVDFADAYLAALGSALNFSVVSFDHDLVKLGAVVLDR